MASVGSGSGRRSDKAGTIGSARRGRTCALLVVVGLLSAALATAPVGAQMPEEAVEPDSLCAPGQTGVIYGTEGADRLVGTAGDDIICGGGGDDRIDSQGGDDTVDAGPGADVITGAEGDDMLFGGDGDDTLDGGPGNDGLWGGAGADTLRAGAGDDGVLGDDGNDALAGGDGRDGLDGGPGDDHLSAAAGDDTLDGGAGNDTLDAAGGRDACVNGETVFGCEDGGEVLDPLATPLPIGSAPSAAPTTIQVDDTFPGVSVTIETDGGIYPWQVEVVPARLHMSGRIDRVLAGPAFDITVPESAPPIRGATLTLPYDESRLDGFPESDLRIYTFDEDAQLWVPVSGPQSVDVASNTVTAELEHLSVYAVLKLRTPEQWAEVFETTPIRCVSADSGVGVDVSFLIDTSGSMGWNDPNGLRVDGAKQFVDAMRPRDRAAVVGFDSFATREIGLTQLDTQVGIDAVKAALERTRNASGGTNISAAVREAIAILSNNGGGGRLRVAVLLTDGRSSYDGSLTTQAADAGIEIHTVALGSDVDEALLRSIAEGTGATYRQLDDASELPALYQELVGDIIDDGTDGDGDGITDCVERNGMFVPLRITFWFIDGSLDFASFITTDPDDPDSDDDGLQDGEEVEARDLRDDPDLAAEYAFLVDSGLTTYYRLIANPSDADSDNDGANDLLEILNGTNPLVPEGNELGIEGLDLPRFTLFQPSRYDAEPAIERRLQLIEEDGTAVIEQIFYNDNPVTYDDDRNCVENCDAVRRLAEARPDDNGWGICVFGVGDCVDDDSQVRDIIEEARVLQGVFDGDGFLSESFLQEQVALQCAIWFADAQACFDGAQDVDFRDDLAPDDYTDALAVGTVAIPAPGVANPETVRRIADSLARTAAAAAAGIGAAALVDVVAECIAGPALRQIGQLLPFVHPCQQLPTYSPGGDVRTAAEHRRDAIGGNPAWVLQRYATAAERAARPFPRNWYLGQPGCTAADRAAAEARFGVAVSCDEFPNWAMQNAGPGASLRYIPAADNGGEGIRLNTFFQACPVVTREVNRVPFLVVPLPQAPATVFHCGR